MSHREGLEGWLETHTQPCEPVTAPAWHNQGLKEAGLFHSAVSRSVTALKRMQSPLLSLFLVPLPARAVLDSP